MMELRFWNDPETGLPHIYNHGVSEIEVRQVLNRAGFDYPEGQKARCRLGQTASGRSLKVVYVPDEGRKSAICDYRLPATRQGIESVPPCKAEEKRMKKQI